MTFYGAFALSAFAAYVAISWAISLLPPPRSKSQAPHNPQPDHGLHDSNRTRSESAYHGWH